MNNLGFFYSFKARLHLLHNSSELEVSQQQLIAKVSNEKSRRDACTLKKSGFDLNRKDLLSLTALVALATAIRVVYLHLMDVPNFDPWRHLTLVKNIRDGLGFTLFDGQPYIWYSPIWYYFCAVFPKWISMEWFATFFSILSVPTIYLLMRGEGGDEDRLQAVWCGLLMAASGPVVAFTCHYGQEALALFLMLLSLLMCRWKSNAVCALIAGLIFGTSLVVRMNFVFSLFLFLPYIKSRKQAIALLSGITLPLSVTWLRNNQIITNQPYVFTWDGLAISSSKFNFLSKLLVQMHPYIQEGLRRLHKIIIPNPEWLRNSSGIVWGQLLFMLCGSFCLIFSKRLHLILAGSLTIVCFLFLDKSMSSHFFRIYLVLFPIFFMAIATVANRVYQSKQRGYSWVAWVLVTFTLLTSARLLKPLNVYSLAMVTPPPELLTEKAYMVNSTFFHPESLIYRFPDKKFIGMPLKPEHFEDFCRQYPEYRSILWHDSSVQNELAQYLRKSGKYQIDQVAINAYGRKYYVLRERSRLGRKISTTYRSY